MSSAAPGSYLDGPGNAPRPSWLARVLFRLQRRRYGDVLAPTRLWVRRPRLFWAFLFFYSGLTRKASPLDSALRSLVMVRVSQINWCAFCVDLNAAIGVDQGLDPAKLAELPRFRESEHFDERERAVLRYAEAMTLSDRSTTQDDIAQLRRYFDDEAIIELTALVAFQNLSSKFNAALGVPAQGLCSVPFDPSPERPPSSAANTARSRSSESIAR